jgi:transcriptional regulator with XRE-family HTH domain
MTAAEPEQAQIRTLFAAPGSGGPTVLRILLGAQLRRLREAKRISLLEAGEVIRASHSKVSRLETGRVGFKDRDIADLLTLYGVTDLEQREALRDLARRASGQGWWHDYSDVLPSWFEAYVGLEEAATQIRSYDNQIVPSLLQTGDYARAVVSLTHPAATAEEVERRVSLRLARQQLLEAAGPPHIWAVVDEAVLRRAPGPPAMMRAQLRHLLDVAERPGVTLQLLPFQAGGHAATAGSFSIMRFAEPDLPDVVYLEQLTSALYLDKRESLDHYLAVLDRLCIQAWTAQDTERELRAILGAAG